MSSSYSPDSSLCFYFPLLSWGSSGGWGRTSCWSSTSCQSRSTSPHIADEAPDVDTGQSLCKQTWPERLNIYASCFNEGIDLILWPSPHRRAEWRQSRCKRAPRRRPWCGWVLSGAAGHGSSCRMKWGPYPKMALASLGEPSTFAAAEERKQEYVLKQESPK